MENALASGRSKVRPCSKRARHAWPCTSSCTWSPPSRPGRPDDLGDLGDLAAAACLDPRELGAVRCYQRDPQRSLHRSHGADTAVSVSSVWLTAHPCCDRLALIFGEMLKVVLRLRHSS